MLDKFHNSNTEHGIDLVAYIYSEMDAATRDRFESHLAGCDECAFELGNYADARLGVIEWRRNDFEPLATPAIIIPDSQPPATFADLPRRRSWTTSVESIFALPRFAKAGIGLATAALLIGVGYFALAAFRPQSKTPVIAGKNVATPVEQKQPEIATASAPSDEPTTPKKSEFVPPPVEVKDRRPEGTRSVDRPQRAALRQTPAVRNYHKIGPLEAVTTAPRSQNSPRLNTFEDEEDTTLRLSDLFSQIGPGKK